MKKQQKSDFLTQLCEFLSELQFFLFQSSVHDCLSLFKIYFLHYVIFWRRPEGFQNDLLRTCTVADIQKVHVRNTFFLKLADMRGQLGNVFITYVMETENMGYCNLSLLSSFFRLKFDYFLLRTCSENLETQAFFYMRCTKLVILQNDSISDKVLICEKWA